LSLSPVFSDADAIDRFDHQNRVRGVHRINVLKLSDDDVKRDAGEILIAAAGTLNEALVG